MRPQSGYGANPPGTSMRTSYGAQQAAGVGASLNTAVEVQARPVVMREGMKGMHAGAAAGLGPGRQVADRTYHISQLRPKVAELQSEIQNMRNQEDSINRSGANVGQLQQRAKALSEEITKLKNKLADLNFAVQQSSTSDPERMQQQAQKLKLGNVETKAATDKLFLSVKDLEAQAKKVSQELEGEMARLDQQIRSDPRAGQYRAVRAEAFQVSDQVLAKQQELRNLQTKYQSSMTAAGRDPTKKKASTLVLEVLKKRQLQEQLTRECSISVEQERENLVQQSKTCAQDIDVLQRNITEAKDLSDELRRRLMATTEDLNDYSGENIAKYEQEQEKCRELQDFMAHYPEREAEEVDKVRRSEAMIVALLDHISRSMTLKETIPQENGPAMIDQMGMEAEEKEKAIAAARETHQRLLKQKDERMAELEKVKFLDRKIAGELEAIAAKVKEQQEEMVRFANIDALHREAEERKTDLRNKIASLRRQRDYGKRHLHQLTNTVEEQKRQLAENALHESITHQEKKLREIWQSAFAIEDFVRMKEKEANFAPIRAECARIMEEVNTMLRDIKPHSTSDATGVSVTFTGK